MNRSIVEVQQQFIDNAQYQEFYCDCLLHGGTRVQQIEGNLCNGKPIVVILDYEGYHVVIGERGTYPPPAVTKHKMYEMIMEEINSV